MIHAWRPKSAPHSSHVDSREAMKTFNSADGAVVFTGSISVDAGRYFPRGLDFCKRLCSGRSLGERLKRKLAGTGNEATANGANCPNGEINRRAPGGRPEPHSPPCGESRLMPKTSTLRRDGMNGRVGVAKSEVGDQNATRQGDPFLPGKGRI